MDFVLELWKPILLGGIAVFVLSALVWTVFPHHRKEWAAFTNEPAVADALRAGSPAPGLYSMPFMSDMKELGTPDGKARMEQGPVAYVTIAPNGVPAMGPMMAKSAAYNIVVAVFVAYVAWHALGPGAEYLAVFRVVGTVTFMSYALGVVPESIWFARPWKSFALQTFDALLYALVMAGVFGWLRP
jgi:hypothetical protein